MTWVIVFLVAENENRQLEDLPQADFGRVHESISLVGKEKVNNLEFCEKKATPIVCFCNGSTLFSARALSPTRYTTFFFADCETYNFHFLLCLHIIIFITHSHTNPPIVTKYVTKYVDHGNSVYKNA